MQVAARAVVADLAKGLSTALVVWVGGSRCLECKPVLTCAEVSCPSCLCGELPRHLLHHLGWADWQVGLLVIFSFGFGALARSLWVPPPLKRTASYAGPGALGHWSGAPRPIQCPG